MREAKFRATHDMDYIKEAALRMRLADQMMRDLPYLIEYLQSKSAERIWSTITHWMNNAIVIARLIFVCLILVIRWAICEPLYFIGLIIYTIGQSGRDGIVVLVKRTQLQNEQLLNQSKWAYWNVLMTASPPKQSPFRTLPPCRTLQSSGR